MDKLLDIKDFQQYSNVSETDRLLFVKGATGTDASISFSLFISILEGKIKPEIINGEWYIGGIATGIDAGATPELRYGATGIEYRYKDTDEWATLVTLNVLQQPAVDIANELKEHPSKVSENYTWLVWDAVSKQYIDTKISARGRSPIIRDSIWWIWSDVDNDYVSTGQTVNSDFVLTKEAVEGVLVGNVTGHHHLEYTVPTLDNAPSETTLTWNDADDNLYMFYVGQLCRVADASHDNGYKFFQLYDIKDGKAIWDEISGGGGVGKIYPNTVNGEIFNDYANNIAYGKNAHAEGQETNATGSRAHAEGYLTKVFAADAHAEGRETWCLGNYGHVQGYLGICYGGYSHTEGGIEQTFEVDGKKIINTEEEVRDFLNIYTTQTTIGDNYYWKIDSDFFDNYYAHGSFGNGTHAEGINNVVCDKAGHVEGYSNICGDCIPGHGQDSKVYAPHAEGINNRIESLLYAPHVGGGYNHIKSGNYSFAHGYNLSVENDYEVSFGKFNASEVDGKPVLFSYGIGTSYANRKNAISVLSDGSVSIPNLNGVTGVDEKLKEFENKLNEGLTALQNKLNEELTALRNKIIGIYDKLSVGYITSPVFVVNDALIITNRVDANVEGTDLVINDEMFIFADGDLSYNSDTRYLTGAVDQNGNLIFTKSIK